MNWRKLGANCYGFEKGNYVGTVKLDGEIWRTQLMLGVRIIDCGEWDSRGVALANLKSAYERARWLRRRIPTP